VQPLRVSPDAGADLPPPASGNGRAVDRRRAVRYGMRILLAAIECAKGDPAANLDAHERVLREAARLGARMAVFPEMSLSGSAEPATQAGWLLPLSSPYVSDLAALTATHGVAAVFGIAEAAADGRAHIAQVYADAGAVSGVYRKRHLGDGEEAFTPGRAPALFRLGGLSFGVAICAEGGVDYPFDEPAAAGAAIVLFSAAPGLYGPRRVSDVDWQRGFDWWESCGLSDARRHARRTGAWIALTTQAGATADEDFPGIAALIAPSGEVVARLPDWRPGLLDVDVPLPDPRV
jgi:predicted amidohydrolase